MPNDAPSERLALVPHPDTPCAAVRTLTLTIERPTSALLTLHYRLEGDLGALRIPEPRSPVRTDGLWQHTCFEGFVGQATGRAYWEYNFSPSGAWAAYQFTSYRSGMAASADAPVAQWHSGVASLELGVVIESAWFGQGPNDALRLGGSAVIESKGGALSYWALSHPSEKPDFHHADSFNVELG